MTQGFPPSTHTRSQTKSRFSVVDVGSFDDRNHSGALPASFEPELVLLEPRPGDGSKSLAPHLYWRTAGVVSFISTLLREGAALAIERGTKRLSESLLDEIEVYADAEGQVARRKRPPPLCSARSPPEAAVPAHAPPSCRTRR